MARKKQHEMPGWFPFAVGASLLGILWAGAKSGWKTPEDQPKPAPPLPPQQVALHGVPITVPLS